MAEGELNKIKILIASNEHFGEPELKLKNFIFIPYDSRRSERENRRNIEVFMDTLENNKDLNFLLDNILFYAEGSDLEADLSSEDRRPFLFRQFPETLFCHTVIILISVNNEIIFDLSRYTKILTIPITPTSQMQVNVGNNETQNLSDYLQHIYSTFNKKIITIFFGNDPEGIVTNILRTSLNTVKSHQKIISIIDSNHPQTLQNFLENLATLADQDLFSGKILYSIEFLNLLGNRELLLPTRVPRNHIQTS